MIEGRLFIFLLSSGGKDLFINAGLTASVFHRGYNFGNAVLPDQIDPLEVFHFLPRKLWIIKEKQFLILEPESFLSQGS